MFEDQAVYASNHWGEALKRLRQRTRLSQGGFADAISRLFEELSETEMARLSEIGVEYLILANYELSRYENGHRLPRYRRRFISLVWALHKLNAMETAEEANRWLALGEQSSLTEKEQALLFSTPRSAVARPKHWGDQLHIFRLEAGYDSQGAWVEAASKLVAALSYQESLQLQSAFEADEDAFDISQTMISRWETGARKPPRDRSRHLCLIWMLAALGGIHTHSEANIWLGMADLKPLTLEEQAVIWPRLLNAAGQGPADVDKELPDNVVDWGTAPRRTRFLGRNTEQTQLESWLLRDRCRLIGIWGIGGQGKTTLAAEVCHRVSTDFDSFIWRSLLNAPPLDEILAGWIQLLSNRQLIELPNGLDEQFKLLFELLSNQRTLLVLDNAESILEESDALGGYRAEYEEYGQLFSRFGEVSHQSCLIVTSREELREFTHLGRNSHPAQDPVTVQSLSLAGLDVSAGEALLSIEKLRGTPESVRKLYERYSGNPLALMLVSSAISEFYGGDAELFLSQEPNLFEDVRELVAKHIERLTSLEQSILYWLAIEREPMTIQELRDCFVTPATQSMLLASLRSLQRRSLVEKYDERGHVLPRFSLQNVVIEYLTAEIVEKACRDFNILDSAPDFLHHHALLKTTSKSYTREVQKRLILEPVARNLHTSLGLEAIRTWADAQLDRLRSEEKPVGYTAGNILNLLLSLQEKLVGFDFSSLPVWHAAMEAHEIHHVNFANADLSYARIYESFGRVLSLAFHPSGQILFVGTTHGQLGAYRVTDLRPIDKKSWAIHHMQSLAVSEDGTTLVSGGYDGMVRIWDLLADEDADDLALTNMYDHKCLELRHTLVEDEQIRSVALCANDTVIATGSINEIRLWDRQSQSPIATLAGHSGVILCLTYSAKHNLLISAGIDDQVLFWTFDPLELKPALVIKQPTKIMSMAISPDGEWLAVAHADGVILLWSLDAIHHHLADPIANELPSARSVDGQSSKGTSICFSPDSHLLAGGGGDGIVRLWAIPSGRRHHLLLSHQHEISIIAFSPDGQILASGSNDRTLRLWDVDSGKELRALSSYGDGSLPALAIHANGKTLVSGGDDGTMRVWNLDTRQCEYVLREQKNFIFSVAISPDGHTFASASMDQTICLWDLQTKQLMHRIDAHEGEVSSLDYHPTSPLLASGSADQTLRLWDTKTGELLHIWTSSEGTIWSLQFSPDGESLVVGCTSGAVFIWSLKSRQLTKKLVHHQDVVWTVVYSPDGQKIASAGFDGMICLWDVETGKPIYTEMAHGGWVRSLAFSPDSRSLASTGSNREVCLWDVENGRELYRHSGKDAVVFHPEGQYFAASAERWCINLWSTNSSERVGSLMAEGPFHGTNIAGAKGISSSQKETLKLMGAIEER